METTHYQQLYLFTKILVESARRAAVDGRKDSARDVLRFVRNARIVEILEPRSGQLLIDAANLDWQLRELARECHPFGACRSDSDKFAEILSRLDLVAGLLGASGVQCRRCRVKSLALRSIGGER